MRKRTLPQNKKSQKIRRERDPIPWRYCLLTLVCGLVLVVGFLFAARQHFASIEYGIKNSKLRKQLDELEAEKRRLILEKEIALTPSEIKKAAKKLGLTEMTASNIEVANPARAESKPKPADSKQPPSNSAAKTEEKPKPEKKAEKDTLKKETKSQDTKDKKAARGTTETAKPAR